MPIRADVQWAGDTAYDLRKLMHTQEQEVRSRERLNRKPPRERVGAVQC